MTKGKIHYRINRVGVYLPSVAIHSQYYLDTKKAAGVYFGKREQGITAF